MNSIVSVTSAQVKNSNISELKCHLWSQPNFSKPEVPEHVRCLKATHAKYPELDSNIRPLLNIKPLRFYNNEIFVRWTLIDTTIMYEIKVFSSNREVLYESVSSACGIKVRAKDLLKEARADFLIIELKRKIRTEYNKGITILLKPIDTLDFEIDKTDIDLVEVFLNKKMFLDALSTLEKMAESSKSKAINFSEKYWNVVDDCNLAK